MPCGTSAINPLRTQLSLLLFPKPSSLTQFRSKTLVSLSSPSASMEFWGVEVKAGEPLKVEPEDGRVVHISQAALGEGKKGNDIVPLRLKINGKMFVVGSLSGEKFPQVSFDLVLEREFELSHDWKNGSVYFCGYTAENPYDDGEEGFDSESSDEDEDLPLPAGITGNGTIEAKVDAPTASKPKAAKPESSAKPKVTVVEPEEDDDSDEDDSDDDSDDEDMMDDVEDEEDSEDEEEETPKKAEAKAGPSKKRPTESATKTPVPAKKVKLDTPQKTDGKKGGGHTATPHPSKKTGKSPAANSNKAKEQTPKSEGKVSCKTCNRTFNSDNALESHSKAKHGST